jgi:hypothetical protein
MAAIQRTHEANAGIDAFINELATGNLADQHRACAAIAFAAAFLGAAQLGGQAQIIQQRFGRGNTVEFNLFTVQKKADRVSHGLVHRLVHGA